MTNLFGLPALFGQAFTRGQLPFPCLPTLKRIISAGSPVSAATLERVTHLIDQPTQVYTPYGATEALPVASIGSREVLSETRQATDSGLGVCVGRPVPGMRARIIELRDEAIAFWSDD